MPSLIDALQAQPEQTDALMRAACARLRDWQTRQAGSAPLPATADERLQRGLQRLAPAQAELLLQRLQQDAELPPQQALLDQLPEDGALPAPRRWGPATDDLARLLRPAELAWDEAREIDWAVRHWEASRHAGLLDEELAADFGEFWRRLEWSALRHHLRQLADAPADERRLLAQVVKVSTRYVALAPLKRALEASHPQFFDQAFSLR